MSCVREQVMMDYLFGRGDWTNYMPSEAGSGVRKIFENFRSMKTLKDSQLEECLSVSVAGWPTNNGLQGV